MERSSHEIVRNMKRRGFLCTAVVTLSALAGCVAGENEDVPKVTRTSAYSADDPSENVEDPRDVTISNGDSQQYEVGVTVRDVDEVILNRTYDVESDATRTIRNVVAKKGEYDVEARLPNGPQESRTWKVSETYSDIDVAINGGTISIAQSTCDPSC